MRRAAMALLLLGCLAWAPALERELGERSFQLSAPEECEPRAILLWLPRPGARAERDLEWWHRSGLVDRGLVVACATPSQRRWRAFEDRPYLLRILFELRRETGLGHRRVFIGGHLQGAQLAQDIALNFPKRFAGCLLVRGATVVQVPAADAEHPVPISIVGNWNDDRVPLKRLREMQDSLQGLGHAVRLVVDEENESMGPKIWQVLAEDLAARGIELAPAPEPEQETEESKAPDAAAEESDEPGPEEAEPALAEESDEPGG